MDIITLPHKLYEEELHKIIGSYLKKPLTTYEIVYSHGSEKGDNYNGAIYRVQIKNCGNLVMSLVLKLPPTSPSRRSDFLVNNFFKREALFYEDVYPLYQKFQEEKGIDLQNDGFHQVPVCYKALTAEPFEGIFFEDLKASGFAMYDRLKEVTAEQVLLVMKILAKMHAIGFAVKDQHPEMIEPYFKLKDGWIELCELENSLLIPWFDQVKNQALEVIEKSSNREMVDKIKTLLSKSFLELLRNCFSSEEMEPYAVICHGDCWNNNIMYRYDENGIPIDLRLLDFQILKYSSPVTDLMYYIFCCTTKSLRDKYYQEFLDVYYQELSNFMERLGSDAKKLFPRETFNDHLKKFGYSGLLMAISLLPTFTSDADDIPDLEVMNENLKKLEKNDEIDADSIKFTTEKTYGKYSERMIGVCEDMFSLGYIF